MVTSIVELVRQFKQSWTEQLGDEMIEKACRDVGHDWTERVLGPVSTLRLFMLQVLNGNTAMTHLPRLARMTFTAGAYCQARARLPLSVFRLLLQRVTNALENDTLDDGRWLGHRVFFVDGSSFSMPDKKPLQDEFGQPGGQRSGCGFPVAHIVGLMHFGTGMITQILTAPLRTHDMSQTLDLHPALRDDDVLVADRGFCSYAHLALLFTAHLHGVFRVHQRQVVDFTPCRPCNMPGKKRTKGLPSSRWMRAFAKQDQLVEWFKPTSRPKWISAQQYATLPESLEVRELRYRITRSGFRCRAITLVTTLLDDELYLLDDLAQLYLDRWAIETAFGHLKTTMGMDVLRSHTVDGVLKELHVFCLIYNLVRLVMLQASRRQGVPPDRISFVDALRWLATALPGTSLPNLVVNPYRPNRLEPRVRKRRPKQYPLMKRPRDELRQTLAAQEDAM
jgi:hypothetical protein